MIQREMYMKRIRPFIGTDLVKVMTGIRRCGKSVMLNLIQDELKASGVQDVQMISFNFEVMSNAHLCTAQALHDEVLKQAAAIEGKVYLFFDEIQEVAQWEKAINSFRIELDCDIYITGSNAKLLTGWSADPHRKLPRVPEAAELQALLPHPAKTGGPPYGRPPVIHFTAFPR